MAWPRTKKSRSSAPPGTHQHNGVQVTVTPAPDADPARASGHNTGVSGTRHSVVDPPPAGSFDARTQYAADGTGEDLADEDVGGVGAGETQALDYDDEPADSGLAILGGIKTTEVPGDAPTAPQPVLNEPIARPPRPVGDVASQPRTPGTGFGTGYGGNKALAPTTAGAPKNVRDLPLDQRLRIWRWRALIMLIVGVAVGLLLRSWPIGLTLAIVAGIIDTVYRARTVASIPTGGSPDRAQRKTQHELAKMRGAGYQTLHARPIPDSREVIDHLVVGPTGVYAIDSEKWHKDMPIRTRNGKQLWHGPDSKKERLEHARWEAQQASDRLSAAVGSKVEVRPAMAVYGPQVPWDIATIRDVDVFSGPRLRKYLRRRARMKDVPRLTPEQVREIYDAAGKVLPDVSPTRASAAPTRSTTPVG
jgi:Nuclease-related domain